MPTGRACAWTHAEDVPIETLLTWMEQQSRAVTGGEQGWVFTGTVRPAIGYSAWESPRLVRPADELSRAGVPVVPLARAGGSYFLGPRQVLLYPVLSLAQFGMDPVTYMWSLEEVARLALDEFGVAGCRREDLNGLWTDNGRIVRVGCAVRGTVARFGLALNVGAVPEQERYVMRCAEDCGVSSIGEFGDEPDIETVASALADSFGAVFGTALLLNNPVGATRGAC